MRWEIAWLHITARRCILINERTWYSVEGRSNEQKDKKEREHVMAYVGVGEVVSDEHFHFSHPLTLSKTPAPTDILL